MPSSSRRASKCRSMVSDRRFDAIDGVRSLDVVAEEYLVAAVLRARVELEEFPGIRRRQHDEPDSQREHGHEAERRPAAMMDAPVERLRIAILQARDPALAVEGWWCGEARGGHRDQRLRNDQRGDHGNADGNRRMRQPDRDLVVGAEQDGEEHHHAGGGAGERGGANFPDTRRESQPEDCRDPAADAGTRSQSPRPRCPPACRWPASCPSSTSR